MFGADGHPSDEATHDGFFIHPPHGEVSCVKTGDIIGDKEMHHRLVSFKEEPTTTAIHRIAFEILFNYLTRSRCGIPETVIFQ